VTKVTASGLANESIKALYEDPDGTLWIGTRGAGLKLLKRGLVTTYDSRTGLSDVVRSFFADASVGIILSPVGRRSADAVLGFRIGAGGEQPLHHVRMFRLRRLHQRRVAVGRRLCVDGGFCLQQERDRIGVPFARRRDEGCRRSGRSTECDSRGLKFPTGGMETSYPGDVQTAQQ
jgi:Two component regulator propeller